MSPQWICCLLEFNGRQRKVWGDSYTELFFLDEVTALAAGHRPCFECRRKDAENFARTSGPGHAGCRGGSCARHGQGRCTPNGSMSHAKRLHRRKIDRLPDGAMVTLDREGAFAVRNGALLHWTPPGYGVARSFPRDASMS